jgi:hypothetical protein
MTSSSFYSAPNWENMWFYLAEKYPADERIYYIGQKWLYFKLADFQDGNLTLNVFCRTVDFVYSKLILDQLYGEDEFINFIDDLVSDGQIFSDDFRVPSKYVIKIFHILKSRLDTDNFYNMIFGAIKANYFDSVVLRYLLDTIINALKLSDWRNYVTYEELEYDILPKFVALSLDEDAKSYMRVIQKVINLRPDSVRDPF